MTANDSVSVEHPRVDLGHRLYITAYFVALALASVLAIIGYGRTGNAWIALLGVANLIVLTFAANGLYGGDRGVENLVRIAGAVFGVAALIALFAVRDRQVGFFTAAQLAAPAVFAALTALGPARTFLRSRRGEVIEDVPAGVPETKWESLFVRADANPAVLRSDAKPTVASLALMTRLTAMALVVCAGVGVVLGLASLVQRGFGVSLILTGLLAAPPAFVLAELASSWGYLGTVQGREKVHFTNIIRDFGLALNCVLAGAVVLGMLCIAEIASR